MLTSLKQCSNIYEIADLLGFRAKRLTYLIYSMPPSHKYTDFCISKKNGGTRTISAPAPQLKLLQRRLSDVLYECRTEILERHGGSRSFGFEKGLGTYENANPHRKKRWVFNSDISDFFPSFNFGRIRGYFLSNNDFKLDPFIATVIAQIACHNNGLPQGAPTSPVIANLICGSLDYRLSRLAKRNRSSYSRYADDITFSTNELDFPSQIAQRNTDEQGWAVGDVLQDILTSAGFQVNHAKSRMSEYGSRQVTTGLVTNHIINTPVEDRKLCRASVHRLLSGKPIEHKFFCNDYKNNCDDDSPNAVNAMQSLESRIVNCYQIRNKSDDRDPTKKFYKPTSIGGTLRDFYLYKYFGKPGRPIILAEGESDILYLKAGLKASSASIPHLCTKGKDSDADILCDFYNFPKLPSMITGLSGGTGNIKIFLEFYHDFLEKLSKGVSSRPFIILLDSDDGIKKVLTVIKSKFGVDIPFSSDRPFFNFARNATLVKTPLDLSLHKSDVEDFLDKSFTTKPIEGRIFTKNDSYDRSVNFGKIELAKKIFEQRHSVDHSNFNKILSRISSAIDAL